MLNRLLLLLISCALFLTCQQPEDATPESRDTFVKFYGYTSYDIGYYAEPTDDGGYIILGNSELDSLSTLYLIKTDPLGNVSWKTRIDSARGKSLKPLSGGSGYLVVGDRIYKKNDEFHFRMLLSTISAEDDFDTATYGLPGVRNYLGSTLTIQDDSVYVLAQEGNNPSTKNAILSKINIEDFNLGWYQRYELNDRGIDIGKSIHLNNNDEVIWTVSNTVSVQNRLNSYLSVPAVKQNSEAVSNDRYPEIESSTEFFFASDIQQSVGGYAVTGSQTNQLNEAGKILFLKTSSTGIINNNSVKFYSKGSDDYGNSISPTADGGFIILGTITSTADVGNGGLDFYLIKVDSQGNLLWDRILGGSGNETGSIVRQTADGGYMVFGTSEINGSNFMCLVKTDKNGEL